MSDPAGASSPRIAFRRDRRVDLLHHREHVPCDLCVSVCCGQMCMLSRLFEDIGQIRWVHEHLYVLYTYVYISNCMHSLLVPYDVIFEADTCMGSDLHVVGGGNSSGHV
jgi:hypothetical protein